MVRPSGGPYRTSGPTRKRRPKIHGHRPAAIKSGQTKSEINVTPLVDVVLVLLIIFMVVTPMLHRGVKIELPETAHHEKRTDSGEQLVVSVTPSGVYIETDKLEGDGLEARLRQELKVTSRPVHIRADKSTRYGDVRKVLEQVHAAGAVSVGLGSEEVKQAEQQGKKE
jgi:biopolymer transport protein TolR